MKQQLRTNTTYRSTGRLRQTAFRFPIWTALILTIGLLSSSPAHARIDDPAYHHLDEIYRDIFTLQEQYPENVRVDSIGHSQEENLPIYAVWLSDDVTDSSRAKPAVIINGTMHAEEVLGVEFVMWLLDKMLTENAGRNWMRRINTYLIPTSNPEGLRVVYNIDNSYRKNKRDNIGDGLFRFLRGWGGDTSGVDLNRNFPTFWINGDQFLVRGTNEFYDYYRGPAPASESETRAMIRFMDRIRPLYSITIHSSRTGNVAQKVIYPWGFGQETKLCPDIKVFDELAHQIARRCRLYGGQGTYEPNRVLYPRGDAEVYYYYEYGTFAVRVEIGDEGEGMQPDSAGIYQVIDDTHLGLEYMLNSAAGIRSDDHGDIYTGHLAITVTDQIAREPVGNARLSMDSLSTTMIPYRTTHPHTGVYYWLLPPNFLDSLEVRKFGYEKFRGVVRASTGADRYRVMLRQLNRYELQVYLKDTEGSQLSDQVEMTVSHPDTFWSETVYGGYVQMNLPQGEYELTFYGKTRYVPRIVNLSVDSSGTWDIALSPAVSLLEQTFDKGDVIFTSDNDKNLNSVDSLQRWELTDDIYHSPPRCLTDSRRGKTIRNEDGWGAPYNMLDVSFDLSGSQTAALVYWLNQSLEPNYDSMWVEVSTGSDTIIDPAEWQWEQVGKAHQKLAILNWEEMDEVINRAWNSPRINYMRYNDWERVVVPLDDYVGQSVVHFRFHLRTDSFDENDGVYIDDVYLLTSGIAPPDVSAVSLIPKDFSLGEPYPNPFNSRLRVQVNLPEPTELNVALYDLNGRLAMNGPGGFFVAGSHSLTVNADRLPSGVYILRAETPGRSAVRKVTLLR